MCSFGNQHSSLQAKHKTWHVCYKQIQRYAVLTTIRHMVAPEIKKSTPAPSRTSRLWLKSGSLLQLILCLLTCFYLWFFLLVIVSKVDSWTVLPQTVQVQIFISFGYNKANNPRVRPEWRVSGISFPSVRSPRVQKWVSFFCQGPFPIQLENKPKISQHLCTGTFSMTCSSHQWKTCTL